MIFAAFKECGYDFITIKDDDFEVVLSSLGASIYSIKIDNNYMTMNQRNIKDFILDNAYHGKTIGRVCNRLPGDFIEIDGKKYPILNNEGKNTLHGGTDGLSAKAFDYVVKEEKGKVVVTFTYLSKHLESGFPGNMNVEVKYTISNKLINIDFSASTDEKTMCSLTNHAFYACGEDKLDNLELMINADRFLHPNPTDLLPLEEREVDKIMDFREFKQISKDIDDSYLIESKSGGYDHYYYFNKVENEPQVSLRGRKYQIDFYSDFNGTQIYTDNWKDNIKYSNSNLDRRRSIAIEPSESQKYLHFLDKGEKYNHYIKMVFRKR